MNNPHFPKNPHSPQMANPHAPQSNFYQTTRPQGQMIPTAVSGQGGTYRNINNRDPQKVINNNMMNQMRTSAPSAATRPQTQMIVKTESGQGGSNVNTNNRDPPAAMSINTMNPHIGEKPQEFTYAEMDRAGVYPECLYCEKKFLKAGTIRVHLRSHSGIRPYKCAICDYRHWYKNPVLSTHFINKHGRKGVDADVLTDIDEENRLIAKTEEEAHEVRSNQKLVYQGHPKKEKKIPEREGGAVFHEYNLRKYDGTLFPPPENNEEENDTSKKLPLSAKLSEAYNNNNRSSPNSNFGRNHISNSNNVQRAPSRVDYEPANVPSELKELSIDKLLNNEF